MDILTLENKEEKIRSVILIELDLWERGITVMSLDTGNCLLTP